ncbi:peroxidase 28-like [Senna tora]|uniref:peroxidase n=1 Tax=Senna tora TaxID=362788 RepID=A0A834T5D1_9FABA|nr:peroxidase 28-like [Senna tora]
MERICFVAMMIFAYLNLIAIPSYYAQPFLFPRPFLNPIFSGYRGLYDDANKQPPLVKLQPKVGNKKLKKNLNNTQELVEGFYRNTCPNAEHIVANQVAEIVKTNPGAIAALIRLQFHDCFVGGCDASILLDSVASGDKVEKLSLTNGQLLKGADLIDDIKSKLEEECPGVVSCADTLAFAAAESMTLGGLPPQPKLGGRRDGLSSLATNSEDNLPFPNWSVDQMLKLFQKKGFNAEDMVVLNGAHSVGSAHCDIFSNRLYNFRNTGRSDPALGLGIVDELKKICKAPGTVEARDNPIVNFDETPTVLDNLLFKDMVEKKRVLLATDQAMANDKRTAIFVKSLAEDPNLFPMKFGEVMSRMSSLGVLTGKQGENYYHKNLIIMCGSLQEIYRKKYGIRPVPKEKEEEEEEIVTHKMEKSDDSEACIDAAEKQPVLTEETADEVAAEEQTVLVKETDLHNVPIQMNHEAHQNLPLQNVEPIPKQHSKKVKVASTSESNVQKKAGLTPKEHSKKVKVASTSESNVQKKDGKNLLLETTDLTPKEQSKDTKIQDCTT